ncbi:MAG: CHAD domain-containing protein [Bryobacterales bacterium]|nr:CHAD domain-containing protein [Bryobacterales bacterium]
MELRRFIGLRIEDLLSRLNQEMERLAKQRDADTIHDVRVSNRRLTQALRALRALFAKGVYMETRAQLRTMMELSSEIRNRDIALELCRAAGVPEEAASCLALRREREAASGRLMAEARKWKKKGLPLGWRVALKPMEENPKGRWRAEAPAGENAREELVREAEEFFRAGRKAARKGTSSRKLHRFRLHTKHFRYLLEVFRPVYGPGMDGRLRRLREVQTLLGDLNDYAVTGELLSGSRDDLKELFAYLGKQRRKRLAEFRECWTESFGREGQEEAWVRYLSHPLREPRL